MIRSEYLETIFIAKKVPDGGWPDRFAVITACNPFSNGDRADDAAATLRLRKHISRMRFMKCRITGASPDWAHQEPGFAVWGLSIEQALEAGRTFFQNAVFWVEEGNIHVVSCPGGARTFVGRWEERFRLWSEMPAYGIYVIRLDAAAMNSKRFREANPCAPETAECLYVGMTVCDAADRFAQHKSGYKACSFVRKHGIGLAHELFPSTKSLPLEAARKLEIDHANELRSLGYAVWQK